MVESTKKTTEEIEKLPGKYDDDRFYILEDGSFYDEYGYFFNKWGFDAEGGHYDDDGVYQQRPLRVGKDGPQKALSHQEIQDKPGEYDEDGFYKLNEGGFYDPYGYYFDEHEMDEVCGKYDEEGIYRTAEEYDEINLNQDYDDESDEDDQDAKLEKQAIYETHVLPALFWVRQELERNAETPLLVKIEGIPKAFNTSELVISKVLERKQSGLVIQNIYGEPSEINRDEMVWYVSTSDQKTLKHLLEMHRIQRCQLNYLETWVFGFPDYLEMIDDEYLAEEFDQDKIRVENKFKVNYAPVYARKGAVQQKPEDQQPNATDKTKPIDQETEAQEEQQVEEEFQVVSKVGTKSKK